MLRQLQSLKLTVDRGWRKGAPASPRFEVANFPSYGGFEVCVTMLYQASRGCLANTISLFSPVSFHQRGPQGPQKPNGEKVATICLFLHSLVGVAASQDGGESLSPRGSFQNLLCCSLSLTLGHTSRPLLSNSLPTPLSCLLGHLPPAIGTLFLRLQLVPEASAKPVDAEAPAGQSSWRLPSGKLLNGTELLCWRFLVQHLIVAHPHHWKLGSLLRTQP